MAISNLRQSAGAVFFAKSTLRFLFLLRDDTSFKNTWAFVGGKINNDEKIVDGLYREIVEEEFIPTLNNEHKGYAWTNIDGWPKPLHPGVFSTVKTQEISDKIATVVDLFRA